jgi:hypothetical protein
MTCLAAYRAETTSPIYRIPAYRDRINITNMKILVEFVFEAVILFTIYTVFITM